MTEIFISRVVIQPRVPPSILESDSPQPPTRHLLRTESDELQTDHDLELEKAVRTVRSAPIHEWTYQYSNVPSPPLSKCQRSQCASTP